MRFLLDVNALIAYGFRPHNLHPQTAKWVHQHTSDQFLTCSITELGFVRILGQVRTYGMDVSTVRKLLWGLKTSPDLRLEFIPDENDVSHLPPWANTPSRTTDGHLLELAKTHGAALATFDHNIPGAYLIP